MKALWKVQENIINKCFHNLEMDVNTPPTLQLGLQNLRKQLSTLNEKTLELCSLWEDQHLETTNQFTNLQWDQARKTLIVSGIKTKKQPRFCRHENGQEGYQFEAETSHDTKDVVKKEILPIFGLDKNTVVKAYRIPRPRIVATQKPPRIAVTFNTALTAHKIMTNLRKLKNYPEASGWHFDKDVPATLRSDKRLGCAISYQFRKYHPKAKVKLNFPKNCLSISVKLPFQSSWTTLSKEDMELYTPMDFRAKSFKL